MLLRKGIYPFGTNLIQIFRTLREFYGLAFHDLIGKELLFEKPKDGHVPRVAGYSITPPPPAILLEIKLMEVPVLQRKHYLI